MDRSVTALAFQPGWACGGGVEPTVAVVGDFDGGVHFLRVNIFPDAPAKGLEDMSL